MNFLGNLKDSLSFNDLEAIITALLKRKIEKIKKKFVDIFGSLENLMTLKQLASN